MGRRPKDNLDLMNPFARWMIQRINARGTNLKRVSEATDIDYSYLFKVKRSHLPQYTEYRRPGFEYTQKLGEHLGDIPGALSAAGYAVSLKAADHENITLNERTLLNLIRSDPLLRQMVIRLAGLPTEASPQPHTSYLVSVGVSADE
jgi:hypothetical protein